MKKGFGGPALIGTLVLILIILAISIFIVNKGSNLLFGGVNTAVSCENPTAGVYSMCAHESYTCPGAVTAELKGGCGLKSNNMIKAFGPSNAASYTTCCTVNVCGDVVDPGNIPRQTLVYGYDETKKTQCIGESAKCNSGNNCCCTKGSGSEVDNDKILEQIDKAFSS